MLLYKRLESGSFQWPRKESEARSLTPQQYRWLMEGLSVDQPKAHKPVSGLKSSENYHVFLYTFSPKYGIIMVMEKKQNLTASNPETVTIFRAEYEKFLGQEQQLLSQNERIFRLENQVSVLTEALRLARHKQFGASSEKSEEPLMEQLSFLFNEAEVFAGSKHKTGRSRCCSRP